MVKSKYSRVYEARVYDSLKSIIPKTVYGKPRERLTDDERAGIDHLEMNGIFPEVLQEDPKASANIDLRIYGERYELKNVTNSTSSVGNQIGRARKKWWKAGLEKPVRVIFTTEHASEDFDKIADAIFAKKRDDEVFIVISSDGRMREE